MKTCIILAKESGTSSIHDVAAECDRKIRFAPGCKYAVVTASYYGGKGYTTHKTEGAAIAASKRLKDYSHQIIDYDGNRYDNCYGQLVPIDR